MSILTYSKSESGLEVVILKSGQAFCTQSSYAAWTGANRTTIVERCKNLEMVEVLDLALVEKPVNFLTGLIKTVINAGLTGNKEVVLIPAKIMGRWLAKDNPILHDEMLDAGANQFLYQIAGYKVKVEQPKPEPQPQILPVDHALKYMDLLERLKGHFGTVSPQLEQTIKDGIGNALTDYTPQLEGKKELWMGVVNLAEVELGYNVPTKGEFRNSSLGTWIRFYHPELSDRREHRLCNETQQKVWVYPVHLVRDELTTAIHAFFADANPSTTLKLAGAFKHNNKGAERNV